MSVFEGLIIARSPPDARFTIGSSIDAQPELYVPITATSLAAWE